MKIIIAVLYLFSVITVVAQTNGFHVPETVTFTNRKGDQKTYKIVQEADKYYLQSETAKLEFHQIKEFLDKDSLEQLEALQFDLLVERFVEKKAISLTAKSTVKTFDIEVDSAGNISFKLGETGFTAEKLRSLGLTAASRRRLDAVVARLTPQSEPVPTVTPAVPTVVSTSEASQEDTLETVPLRPPGRVDMEKELTALSQSQSMMEAAELLGLGTVRNHPEFQKGYVITPQETSYRYTVASMNYHKRKPERHQYYSFGQAAKQIQFTETTTGAPITTVTLESYLDANTKKYYGNKKIPELEAFKESNVKKYYRAQTEAISQQYGAPLKGESLKEALSQIQIFYPEIRDLDQQIWEHQDGWLILSQIRDKLVTLDCYPKGTQIEPRQQNYASDHVEITETGINVRHSVVVQGNGKGCDNSAFAAVLSQSGIEINTDMLGVISGTDNNNANGGTSTGKSEEAILNYLSDRGRIFTLNLGDEEEYIEALSKGHIFRGSIADASDFAWYTIHYRDLKNPNLTSEEREELEKKYKEAKNNLSAPGSESHAVVFSNVSLDERGRISEISWTDPTTGAMYTGEYDVIKQFITRPLVGFRRTDLHEEEENEDQKELNKE